MSWLLYSLGHREAYYEQPNYCEAQITVYETYICCNSTEENTPLEPNCRSLVIFPIY
jgi:hypothetical protein